MLKEKQQMIEEYFEAHGLPVQSSFIRNGLSIYTRTRKTPIARFVPVGNHGSVEVMWYSHRDKWDHIGDFGGMTMPLDEALEYVVSDAPGCFMIDFLMYENSRM